MYLKSLILKGFKSFADRSVLGYEPGITAIVGPNGSGKSNISDAVLWVLGERNAKNLRGQAMEDVIFAGSSARKPVGIAEVELVLDNSDATLPIDFDEVSIARRMYRNGESEYLINGAVVRRMDVLDILHDTGLGTGTHSIISQGSLDSILQSKPEDRRSLIEEAAGVLKHKQRKQKSERKLALMDTHLTRVKDVAAEVERQLKPLERKAKRAQAYQGLAQELADLNLALAVDDLRNLQVKWKQAGERETTLGEELERMRTDISEAEGRMQKLQEDIQERSVNAGDLARRYRQAQSVIERFDSTVLLLQEKKRSSQTYETDLNLELEANRSKQKQAEESIELARLQLETTTVERDQAVSVVERLQQEQTELYAERAGIEKLRTEYASQEKSLVRDIEATRSAQTENQEQLMSSRAHEKLITGHGKELEIQIEHAHTEFESITKQARDHEEELEQLKKKEAEAKEEVAKHFTLREKVRQEVEELQNESALLVAETKGLEERERTASAASPALSWIMEHQNRFQSDMTQLSHVIHAPEELDSLLEWLLGKDLSALLVKDLDVANRIADSLCHQEESGEVILLPSTDARSFVSQKKNAEAPRSGTALMTLLRFDPEYESTLEAILGDVYLCESIDEAIAAHETDTQGFRFVTRDGFMIWGNSKISIGMNKEDEEGVLARHRRLDVLRSSTEQNEEALKKALSDKERIDQELQQAQSASLRLAQDVAQLQGTSKASQEERRRAEDKLLALKRQFEDNEKQRNEALALLSQAQPASEEFEKKLVEFSATLDELKTKLAESAQELDPLQERIKQVDQELSEARLQAATLSERASYTTRMLESHRQELDALKRAYDNSIETLVKKGIAKERVEPLLVVFEELSRSAKKWAQGLEDATTEAQDSSSGLHHALTEARSQSRKAHEAFDAVNDKLSEARIEKGRLEVQVETAIDTIVHDCKTPLETALETPALENRGETEDTAFKLRRRIANMGTINPDAAVEYEELKTRFDYMSSQLEDMMSARRALSKIIRVIDARMKDDFITTFEAVNENFKEIFTILFPGGSAELSLVDPEDQEHTGVEVSAQPRGKRITKMMLMSGGEKSLTALALLFAVYRIRSTPFYILDEVEAALDDTNLRRLCAYFDSLRDSTQLILITHQRRTMEMADVLYGISMQADGVTRVVSQKLDRALQYAEER